jgi:hypothetical protein
MIISNVRVEIGAMKIKIIASMLADTICGLDKSPSPAESTKTAQETKHG